MKRRAYRTDDYWSKPVPGFGDPWAKLFIVGSTRCAWGKSTGRMFTGRPFGRVSVPGALGDRDWQPGRKADRGNDGFELKDAYMAAAVRCVPPDNKPSRDEILTCRPYLATELALFTN